MNKEAVLLQGESGNFLQLAFEQAYGFPETTSWQGGYEVRCTLTIKSAAFQVRSTLFITTAELFTFYQELWACQKRMIGKVAYTSFEEKLNFQVEYDEVELGQVHIGGQFTEAMPYANTLDFAFLSDQSFIQATLVQLKRIANRYGNA